MEGAHVSKSEKSSEWNMYSKTLQGAEVMQIKANAHVTRGPELHNSAGYSVHGWTERQSWRKDCFKSLESSQAANIFSGLKIYKPLNEWF